MEMEIVPCATPPLLERCHIGYAVLSNFRGHADVEIHLFRSGASEAELEDLRGKDLVGPPDPSAPPQALAGATEEAALRSILECFTYAECQQLAAYLQKHYEQQIRKLILCPMDFPVPLGVGPLASYPQTRTSGFVNFDEAQNYDLPFAVKAYYELS